MRRNLQSRNADDRRALINDEGNDVLGLPPRRQVSFSRVPSHSSLDPNEDPVTGLERVSSISSLQAIQRRRDRERRIRELNNIQRRPTEPESASHPLSDVFESLDYEIVDNELYRAEETSKDHQVTSFTLFYSVFRLIFILIL